MGFVYSVELTLICFTALPFQFVGTYFVLKSRLNWYSESMKSYNEGGFIVQETLENIKTVSSLNCQLRRSEEYNSKIEKTNKDAKKFGVYEGIG